MVNTENVKYFNFFKISNSVTGSPFRIFTGSVQAAVRFAIVTKKLFFSTPSPVDRWHHVAVVWDRTNNEVYLYLNGTRVATQGVQAHWYIVFNLISTHDIGLKADDGATLKGFLSDLMVFGEALNEDGMRKILGNLYDWLGVK